MGFNAEEALDISLKTISGGVALLEETKALPSELKWKVCSPAGTTIAGLHRFEEHAVRAGLINTFLGAFNRAKELGK